MQEKMDQWINWVEYDELLEGRHNAPHNLLGLHSFGRGQVLTVYRPEAERVFITDMSGKNELELRKLVRVQVFLENIFREKTTEHHIR